MGGTTAPVTLFLRRSTTKLNHVNLAPTTTAVARRFGVPAQSMSATPTRSAGPLHAALASINSNWHGFLDAVRSPVAPPSQKRPRLAPEAERDASDTARGKRRRVEPDTAARKTLRGPSARKAAAGNTPGKRKAVPTGDFNFVPRPLVLPSKARPASVTPVLTLSPATSTRPSSAETTPGRYSRVDKGKARQVVLDPIDLTGPEAVEPLESALVGERVGRQLARSYQEVVEGEKRLRSERDEERRRVRELRAEIVKLTKEVWRAVQGSQSLTSDPAEFEEDPVAVRIDVDERPPVCHPCLLCPTPRPSPDATDDAFLPRQRQGLAPSDTASPPTTRTRRTCSSWRAIRARAADGTVLGRAQRVPVQEARARLCVALPFFSTLTNRRSHAAPPRPSNPGSSISTSAPSAGPAVRRRSVHPRHRPRRAG